MKINLNQLRRLIREELDILNAESGNRNVMGLVDNAMRALADVKDLKRYTPFSGWYKGEHGKAHRELTKALKGLVAGLKGSKETQDAELMEDAEMFLASHSAKEGGETFFEEAVAKWRAAKGY